MSTYYISSKAKGNGDGSSNVNAFPDWETALKHTVPGDIIHELPNHVRSKKSFIGRIRKFLRGVKWQ